MKHAANGLTISRMVLVLILILALALGLRPLFIAVYLLCGLTDVLDGYVARKTKTATRTGARLDSAADIVFFGVVIAIILSKMPDSAHLFLILAIAAAAIRAVNLAVAVRKYEETAILHTWGNKLTGFFLFAAPLFLIYGYWDYLWLPCLFAILSAAEETVIHATSPDLDLNRKTFFKK